MNGPKRIEVMPGDAIAITVRLLRGGCVSSSFEQVTRCADDDGPAMIGLRLRGAADAVERHLNKLTPATPKVTR